MNDGFQRWIPEPVTLDEAIAILANCDEFSQAAADLQSIYITIAKSRGWGLCNTFNGGDA